MSPMPFGDDKERSVVPIDDRTGAADSMLMAPPSQNSSCLGLGARLGEFEIARIIGIGGFGIVYLAFDHSLQRNVAIKEYMPAALAARTDTGAVVVKSNRQAETFRVGLKSFVNEAHLLAQYDHPSLLKVYRFWEANGTAYMAMPFYEGITLKQTIKNLNGSAPDERWLKEILRPLADALALIHRGSCFHRDIAPDNILILKSGQPLLLDFGAARRVIGDMTHALTVILKPGYAPIEQYAETPNLKQGAWTDIYALAAVVYFAISGQAPVPSVARMMSDPLVPIAKLGAGRYSAAFLRGIDKAMSVRPEQRPQSIAELCNLLDLGEVQQEAKSPPAIKASTGKTPTANPRRDKSVLRFVASTAALLSVGGIATYLALSELKPKSLAAVPPAPITTAPAKSAPVEAKERQLDDVKNVELLPAGPVAIEKTPASSNLPEPSPRPEPEIVRSENKTEGAQPSSAGVAVHSNAAERTAAPVLPKPLEVSARCTDILQRASLGEPLTLEEQTALKGECK